MWVETEAAAIGALGALGQPRRLRLLNGLAERLQLAGVDEEVEGGERDGELVAGQLAEEHRPGQQGLQLGALGAVADDDEARAGQVCDGGEILDALLGGEAAHIADEALAVRR